MVQARWICLLLPLLELLLAGQAAQGQSGVGSERFFSGYRPPPARPVRLPPVETEPAARSLSPPPAITDPALQPAGLFVPSGNFAGAAPGQEELPSGPVFPRRLVPADTASRQGGNTAQAATSAEEPAWMKHLRRLEFSGHVRIRHETDAERLVGPTRNRQRLRARLALTYRWNSEVRAGVRWTTGDRKIVLEPDDRAGSPLSYQDAGDVLDKVEFNLDRLFIHLQPRWMPAQGWVTLGKFRNPVRLNPIFAAPVGDLVWDEAAHPEGVAAGWRLEHWLGIDRVEYLLGESWVLELANQDDASLFFTQLWFDHRFHPRWQFQFGFTWYDWNNLNPDGNTRISAENNVGNAVVPVGPGPDDVVFASGFSILNPLLVLSWQPPGLPALDTIQVVWEYFYNTQSFDADLADGFSIGMQLGPAVTSRKQGAWKIYYTWNEVRQESVFTPVVQDDFQLASNFRGHWMGLDWFVWDEVELRLWILSSQPIQPVAGSRQTQWRFRIDLTTYF